MIIAGTGHRPDKLGGYGIQAYQKIINIAADHLKESKPSLVISGMAQGWDMAIAQAAIRLKIPFDAYIPFEGQDLRWPEMTRLYYKELLKRANQVVICSPGDFSVKAMNYRNERMVDACDLVVAMWNGTPGGTCNALAYAKAVKKPHINLWDVYDKDRDSLWV